MTWLAAGLGGALGSLARHWMNLEFARHLERSAPHATATVNLLGALAAGVLAGALAGGFLTMTPTVRTFVFVGLLGGFTTFSSLMLDTLTLVQGGSATFAVSNLLLQNIFGAALIWAGYHGVLALR